VPLHGRRFGSIQAEQSIHCVDRALRYRGRAVRIETFDRVEQLSPLRVRIVRIAGCRNESGRIVSPHLEDRSRDHAIANYGDSGVLAEHKVAPLARQVPVVGDVMVVPHHVARDVGHRSPNEGQCVVQQLDVRQLFLRSLLPALELPLEPLDESLETLEPIRVHRPGEGVGQAEPLEHLSLDESEPFLLERVRIELLLRV
jgi:hypothetical protein